MLRRLRFLLYLGVTFLLWLSIQLTADYTVVLEVPVKYANIPAKLKLTRSLPDHFQIQVKGQGQDLILPYLGIFQDTVEVDLRQAVQQGRLLTGTLGDHFKAQFPDSYTILGIVPEAVPIYFVEKVQKRVPVVPRISIKTDAGYYVSRTVQVEPDSVLIYGAEDDLASHYSWPTEEVVIDQIHESGQLSLSLARDQDVLVSQSKVKAIYRVDRLTEVSRELKVTVDDMPPNEQVRILPSRVMVHYLVPLDRYDSFSHIPIKVEVYADEMLPGASHVVPHVKGLPAYLIGVRTDPPVIRFVKQVRP